MFGLNKTVNSIFHTYNRLYPGKADVIMDAISNAQARAEKTGMSEEETLDLIESEIIDRVDP